MRKISKIEPKVPMLIPKKKVAAYARVSMETERLQHSLSAQVSYYSDLIQKNPDWEYAGVYADYGISGTSTRKRDEFQRMLEDCEAGKIDVILTKSISRFARNTVDLLKTVRHLKELGIEVRFEKENIYSLSGDGEMMLSILASFAQEESRSISENIRWATQKRFEKGIPNGHFRIFGYRWEGDQLVIEPEEAKIVKRIFQNFLDGKSRLETEREFAAEGITTRAGCRWVDSNIKKVLTNITYTGNLLFQKEFVSDPIEKHRRQNHGELPQYFVENTHEAIIDLDTFRYVQSEIERRKKLGPLANKSLNITAFTSMIRCERCGSNYQHSICNRNGFTEDYWICASRRKGNTECTAKGYIPTEILKRETAAVLEIDSFDEDAFHERVDYISVPAHRVLIYHMKDGREIKREWRSTAKKDCWTEESKNKMKDWMLKYMGSTDKRYSPFTTRIKCGCCGKSCYRNSQRSPLAENGKRKIWRCKTSSKCNIPGIREDDLLEISAQILGIDEFDGTVFREKVERITMKPGGVLEFALKDGQVKTAAYISHHGHKWTPAQRENYMKSIKDSFPPERRQKMSENMKRIRAERHWSSTGRRKDGEEGKGNTSDDKQIHGSTD